MADSDELLFNIDEYLKEPVTPRDESVYIEESGQYISPMNARARRMRKTAYDTGDIESILDAEGIAEKAAEAEERAAEYAGEGPGLVSAPYSHATRLANEARENEEERLMKQWLTEGQNHEAAQLYNKANKLKIPVSDTQKRVRDLMMHNSLGLPLPEDLKNIRFDPGAEIKVRRTLEAEIAKKEAAALKEQEESLGNAAARAGKERWKRRGPTPDSNFLGENDEFNEATFRKPVTWTPPQTASAALKGLPPDIQEYFRRTHGLVAEQNAGKSDEAINKQTDKQFNLRTLGLNKKRINDLDYEGKYDRNGQVLVPGMQELNRQRTKDIIGSTDEAGNKVSPGIIEALYRNADEANELAQQLSKMVRMTVTARTANIHNLREQIRDIVDNIEPVVPTEEEIYEELKATDDTNASEANLKEKAAVQRTWRKNNAIKGAHDRTVAAQEELIKLRDEQRAEIMSLNEAIGNVTRRNLQERIHKFDSKKPISSYADEFTSGRTYARRLDENLENIFHDAQAYEDAQELLFSTSDAEIAKAQEVLKQDSGATAEEKSAAAELMDKVTIAQDLLDEKGHESDPMKKARLIYTVSRSLKDQLETLSAKAASAPDGRLSLEDEATLSSLVHTLNELWDPARHVRELLGAGAGTKNSPAWIRRTANDMYTNKHRSLVKELKEAGVLRRKDKSPDYTWDKTIDGWKEAKEYYDYAESILQHERMRGIDAAQRTEIGMKSALEYTGKMFGLIPEKRATVAGAKKQAKADKIARGVEALKKAKEKNKLKRDMAKGAEAKARDKKEKDALRGRK